MRQSRKRTPSAAAKKSNLGPPPGRPRPGPRAIQRTAASSPPAPPCAGWIEACPLPLLVPDLQGRLHDLNESAARLMGLSRETLLGKNFCDCFTSSELARSALEETWTNGFVTGRNLTLRHASGALTDVLLNTRARRDEHFQVVGAFAFVRDLTADKQRRSQLDGLQTQLRLLSEELKQRESELRQISKLYDVLQTCNFLYEAYPAIASAASELFPQCDGALAMIADNKRELETVAQWGRAMLLPAGFPLDDCWALRQGRVREVHSPGTPLECRHFQGAPTAAYTCLPLSVRGELQGLLHLSAAPGQPIAGRNSRLLATLGEVVKLSLSNLKLREVLKQRATTDPLTALFNRHYMEEMLRRELARSQRSQAPLCLALLDIDNFKAFNDSHGHEAGDAVLKALAGFFRARLRGSDIACRYGGDEFLLALLDTGAEQVLPRLEQLCSEIPRLEITSQGTLLPPLAVSMGVAQSGADAGSLEQLLRAADQALYRAKRGGRNRIQLYDPGPSENAHC